MGKIVFESKYEVGDVVAFEKNDRGLIGIVEGYYIDNGEFWYNIRLNNRYVLTYSNGGDVGEESILFKLTDLKNMDVEKLILTNLQFLLDKCGFLLYTYIKIKSGR